MKSVFAAVLAMLVASAMSAAVVANEKAPDGGTGERKVLSTEEKALGREGDPKKVSRSVQVDMSDAMRFSPAALTIRQGETIRFEVKNSGKNMHEMVLGTMKELKGHSTLMKKHSGMEHNEPYMAHVAPGKTGRIVWQFTQPGELYYGCLIPGHFEAGMLGKINVRAR